MFETQYLNVSFKESKAATEIQEKIQRVKSDLAAIDALDSKYKLNAKDVYVRTLDMSQAMAENARLIKFEEQMEADRKRKAEEEERRRAEAEARAKEAEERRRQEARKKCCGTCGERKGTGRTAGPGGKSFGIWLQRTGSG